jgi:pyruvate/2-oxoglutarate dehydrogenase complex dihydrolipoamide acyltransferase (E2) component
VSNVFFNNPFWTYWALTFAVFLIFAFSFVVAAMDIREEVAEALRKAQRRGKPKPRFENPLADRTVAATLDPGANRALPPQLQWVYDQVAPIARRLGIEARILVYEDSKGHPLVHLTDGRRLVSYRLDRTLAEEARGGNEASLAEAQRRLEAFMRLEWLGDQTAMQRTTELAKEAKATSRTEAKAAEPEASPTPEPAAAQAQDPKAAERQRLIEEAKARAAARRAQQAGSGQENPES